MKKRTRLYLSILKGFKQKWGPVRRSTMSLATQAEFPDSGYFYACLERKLLNEENDVYEYVESANKKWLRKLYARLQRDLSIEAARASHQYYEVVQVVDKNGRCWTAYEMDRAMAYH